MVSVTKRNTPALRFDGFDDEWTQSRLSDHLTLSEDTNANLEFGREDVYAVSLEEGLVNQIKFHGRSFASKNLDNYDVIHAGEIVYTKSPLKFTPYGIFKSHFGATGIVSPLYAVYRTKPHADARFVQDYFALPERLNTYLSPLVNKGAKNTMNISDWNALGGVVTFPPSLEEQRAIGELFADLDALIGQHRAKHANLQQTKTALMQRMFPQDGADAPELRLGEFNGAWETVSFDSLLTRVEIGTNILGSNRYHGIPLLKMGNIQRGYFDFTSFERLPDSAELPSASLVRTGDFLFNTRNTMELVGKGATWMGESGAFAFNGNVARFTLERVDTEFFNYLYNHPRSIRDVSKCATGTTSVAAIYPRSLKSVKFQIPPLDEQRAIGEVFADLDALIAAEHRYTTQLTQVKTALLQRMFV